MVNHKLTELINKISDTNLSESEKESLILACKDIKTNIQTIEQKNQEDIKQTYQKLSQLEEFEINHPDITSCIDILARTLSRLGI